MGSNPVGDSEIFLCPTLVTNKHFIFTVMSKLEGKIAVFDLAKQIQWMVRVVGRFEKLRAEEIGILCKPEKGKHFDFNFT